MKNKILGILICCLLVSCIDTPSNETTQFVVTDALEREIEFSDYPERIVIAGKQTPMLANFFYLFPSKVENLLASFSSSNKPDLKYNCCDLKFSFSIIFIKEGFKYMAL